MSLSLRQITRSTFTVYDGEENLVGRVFKDGNQVWYAQTRVDQTWAPTPPRSFKSRKAALASFEVAA